MSISITSATNALDGLELGQNVSVQLTATSTGAGPLEWASSVTTPGVGVVFQGRLPKGLTLTTGGLVIGQVREAGSFSVSVAIGDRSSLEYATQIFTGTVNITAGNSIIDRGVTNIDVENVGSHAWFLVTSPRFSLEQNGELLVADAAMNPNADHYVRLPEGEAKAPAAEGTIKGPVTLPATATIIAPNLAVD